MLVAGCYSGAGDFDSELLRYSDETIETVENLRLAGYPDYEIRVLEDGTVFVGQDAIVTLDASREMVQDEDDDEFRQYRTNNLVDTSAVQVICVNPTGSFAGNATLSAGLDAAIANYNARALQFTMQRGGGGCDANITANMDNSGGGVAGFPSGGQPYSSITIGQTVGTYGLAVATHVIQHELGHCIGFRHTDYFDRSISCGGFPSNEGDGGVGAVHIPGTPTTNVNANTSVMNSCFSGSSNGIWTSSDEVALEVLYGTGGVAGTTYDVIETNTNQSGGSGQQTTYGPYDASSYDAIRFLMSGGSGDADLYVRFGAAPTTSNYDCRPYLHGNDESCEFNPAQSGSYYVMVRGYSAYSGVTLTVEAAGGGEPPPPPPPPPEPDPEVCDNGVDDDGDGDTDCVDTDCSADPACQPSGGPEVLFFNGFESGWGNFNDGGSDARRSANDSNYANTGTYCARIRDNSGSTSSIFTDPFSLTAYSELTIDFYYYARSMENGEDFFVEVYDGSSWVVVGNYARGSDFSNNSMNNATITVSSADVNFASGARLRFRNDASNNSDWIYIDDVTVSAQ